MKHNIYFAELSPFERLFRTGLPVLCYHKIGHKPAGTKFRSIYLGTRAFSKQLAQLRFAGFRSLAMDECANPLQGDAVALTFDDGSLSVLRNALEPLASFGFRAINYLVSDRIGGTNDWDTAKGEVPDRLMDEAQVREWISAGHEIGAHTRTHPKLSKIPLDRAREEIVGSKKSLEDRFGVAIRHFCYPYGDYSPAVRDLVQEAGYATGATTRPGIFRPGADLFSVPRIGARSHSLNLRNVFKRLLRRPLVDVEPLLN